MPFDRDSFLKGVITGMRLPRTPGGRPPFEPVPSGIYILAEDGRNIIAEKIQTTECTIYDANNVYLYESISSYEAYLKYETVPQPSEHGAVSGKELFFYADITDGPSGIIILTLTDGDGRINNSIKYYYPDGSESSWILLGYSSWYYTGTRGMEDKYILKKAGIYYYAYTYGLRLPYDGQGLVRFEGTTAELVAFISSLKDSPLITE